MHSTEQEALARQLWSIYDEAWPTEHIIFDDMKPFEREAWIQVAQFVASRDADLRNHLTEVVNNREWPDHR